MRHIFISYVAEDGDVVLEIAKAIEDAGFPTWYYQRDSRIGSDYLQQTGDAIEEADAVLLLISSAAFGSHQITKEVHRAHEANKPFLPILRGVTHLEFQRRQPSWRQALGTTVSMPIPENGIASMLPKLIAGLRGLGMEPRKAASTTTEQESHSLALSEFATILCPDSHCHALNPMKARCCVECGKPLPLCAGVVVHGRYQLVKRLSWVPMLETLHPVYLGRDLTSKSEVRIKCFHFEEDDEAEYAFQYLEREATALRIVGNAPCVVNLRDVFREDKFLYLVTDWIPGVPIDAAVKARGEPFALEQVVEWGLVLSAILRGMHYHNPPWIASTLELRDLILATDGSIHIVNMSEACPLDEEGRGRRIPPFQRRRSAKSSVCEIDTMNSPEQSIGRPEPRSDLFTLASILYFLRTGITPDGDQTSLDIADELEREDCPIPAEERWFFELLKRNLSEEKSARHLTMDEFRNDLSRRRVSVQEKPIDSGKRSMVPNVCSNPACRATNHPLRRYCEECHTPIPLRPGFILHGYLEVERIVGKGGFSFVYGVRDLRRNRQLAVKDLVCQDSRQLDASYEFFRREHEILNLLEGVVSFVPRSYGTYINPANEAARIFLELVKGRSLGEILRANPGKRFRLQDLVQLGIKLAELLHCMHSLDPPWVYRDMKPDQIMMVEGGKSIKVLDFGSARPIDRNSTQRGRKSTRVITQGYSAPEQILGRPVPASDLFSLAATLYHLYTGEMPDGLHTGEELESRLKDRAGDYSSDEKWFYRLLRTNLSEHEGDRFASALEFKQRLQRGPR